MIINQEYQAAETPGGRSGHGVLELEITMPQEPTTDPSTRITVPEIAHRLHIGRMAVYAMLENGTLPGIRIGRRWLITRHAYEQWERNCGLRSGTGLSPEPEVQVLN